MFFTYHYYNYYKKLVKYIYDSFRKVNLNKNKILVYTTYVFVIFFNTKNNFDTWKKN